jgi:inorganic pyrophosphatase
MKSPILRLPAVDPSTGELNAVIETPKGSRNKLGFDPKLGLFKLKTVLPAGAVFPFDFGMVPNTIGEDGDPLDVLVLMDEPVAAGVLVPARLIGVIEAEQTEKGKTERNDRLIAVAADSRTHHGVRALSDLSETLVCEIEHFFESYNEARGKRFKPVGRAGPDRAQSLVRKGEKAARKKKSGKKSAG